MFNVFAFWGMFAVLLTFQTAAGGCPGSINIQVYVNETDPPGTVIWHIQSVNATWSSSVNYNAMRPLTGGLDHYLVVTWDNTTEDYLLRVNTTLDLEAIKRDLNVELDILQLKMMCDEQGGSIAPYDLPVIIKAVNEFYPEFRQDFFRKAMKEEDPIGSPLIKMEDVTVDHDVEPGRTDKLTFFIRPFSRLNGSSKDDGRDYFTMAYSQTGLIVLSQRLDFEVLLLDNRTVLWLNVTAQDTSGSLNWTTVEVTVADVDDQGPEFYLAKLCDTRVYPSPPCPIAYTFKVPVNATGAVNQTDPAPILARDRDTINNPVKYSLLDSAGAHGVASYFALNNSTGHLQVVSPFAKPGVFSLYVLAEEVSNQSSVAQATLQVDVYLPAPAPGATQPCPPVASAPHKCEQDNTIAAIGLSILGVVCLGLLIALFATCFKLRQLRRGRVGSLDNVGGSTRSLGDEEEKEESPPASGLPSSLLKKQDEVLSKLPDLISQPAKTLPPLARPATGDVFDGTKTFPDHPSSDFFTAPGKIKVPLLPPIRSKDQGEQPIVIDDNDSTKSSYSP